MFVLEKVKFLNVVDVPSLIIPKNKVTSIVGESGGGKTTILKLLNKMISPSQGNIFYNDISLNDLNTTYHRRKVLMLSQNSIMFGTTVKDNLLLPLLYRKDTLFPSDDILSNFLEKVSLNKKLDSLVSSFSGGEKQRLAIARILVANPDVYLLDEPTSALDEDTANSIMNNLLSFVQEQKKTLIMITHSEKIAKDYSDVIITMFSGKVLKYESDN
jgi:putative ABC transport system ATP-binding protein